MTGACKAVFHQTNVRKRVISHDADFGWKQAYWSWKAHSKAYKFMFHEAFYIPTFARPKRAKNMSL